MPSAAKRSDNAIETGQLLLGVGVSGVVRHGQVGVQALRGTAPGWQPPARASSRTWAGLAPTRCIPVSTFRWTGTGRGPGPARRRAPSNAASPRSV